MQLDFQERELTVKLVYYGPGLSGKTTNLEALHRLLDPKCSGRLLTLETKDDRTLFFDLLPLTFRTGSSVSIRLKLFTVPGQVIHDATRRLVLQAADGVAFIADSQRREIQANRSAFLNMQTNLKENGMVPEETPLVIQFNKRDLADIRTDEEIDLIAAQSREPVHKAIAIRGVGVAETFLSLVTTTWSKLERDHALSEKFGVTQDGVLAAMGASLLAARTGSGTP